MNNEGVRRLVVLVAGIGPALIWALTALTMIVVPALIIWPIAAWLGCAGLLRVFSWPPCSGVDPITSTLLLCGLGAMAPVIFILVAGIPQWWSGDSNSLYAFFTLSAICPVLVAVHYLFLQLSLALAAVLSELTGERL